LGYVCDSELHASILSIDGTSGINGSLKIKYDPCTHDGRSYNIEEGNNDPTLYANMPDELYVGEPD